MDTLNLALKLMGKEKTTEERNEAVNPSTASIIHMIAVTPSSGGKVVLMDEIESSTEWSEGDYMEIEEDGTFEEYESEDDPLEDVDDSVVDMTDGDGADIEETDAESVSFSVTDYQAQASEAYATEAAAEEEPEATEDDLADENTGITDAIDDGDATELPDDGETSEEDDLADENASIGESTDDEYTLIDDNSDDESDDYVEGAEISDGYTVAECIGSINAGDRVAVMVQDGKVVVLGVVGSGDEQRANTEVAQETADEAIIASEISQAAAEAAQEAATAAQGKADEAKTASQNAQAQAEEAAQAANNAQTQAQSASEQAQAAQNTAATAQTQAQAAQSVADAVKADVEQTNKDMQEYANSLEALSNTMQADYAKKTELSETEASLQTQISQNAGSIESVATKVTEVDETVNKAVDEAKQQAATAQQTAQAAQAQAATAQQTADNAQTSANTAQAAAEAAQSEADTAQAAAEAARNIADQAETDLEAAKQNLAAITSRVDATEDEIAAAEAAVDTAQAAADAAKADAQVAQQTADNAKASATTAQAAADNAKSAANAAQAAADNAKAAADKAQADVDSLAVRVTTAETKILQNAEQIALMATRTEVAETLGGYYTKEQTDAAIKVQADNITSSVKSTYATKQEVENIEVGGRNLLYGNGLIQIHSNNPDLYPITCEETEENGISFYRVKRTDSSLYPNTLSVFNSIVKESFNYKEMVGQQVTLSLKARASREINASFMNYAYSGNNQTHFGKQPETITTDWKTYFVTINKFPEIEDGGGIRWLPCMFSLADGEFDTFFLDVRDWKFEKGNKATDWTPAPEDMATDDDINEVHESLNETNENLDGTLERVLTSESVIQQLSDAISMLVIDEEGTSLLEQTGEGWKFNLAATEKAVTDLSDRLNTLQEETGDTKKTVDVLNQAIADANKKLDYVSVGTYENEPCIELGENDSDYKLMITNKRIMFHVGSNIPTLINTNGLVTKNIEVEGEIIQGGFVQIITHDNGWGLLWKGVSE